MKCFSTLILLFVGIQLTSQQIYGFRPENDFVCIVNDNKEQVMNMQFSIDNIYFENSNKNSVDSFFIDALIWNVNDGTTILYQNNIPVTFPLKIDTKVNYDFTLKVKCRDEVSIVKPIFIGRLYKNNSPVVLDLDNELYELLFDDTIPKFNITTHDYKITIANDSVCSTMSEKNFKINTSKGELNYKWLFNNDIVSTSDSFYYYQSGTVKLETTLAINKCPAESKTYSVYYENPPNKVILKKDVWNASILLDKFDTTNFPDFVTLWYRDNELYTNNITRITIPQPEIGTYYAVLQGKICKLTTNSLEVDSLASISTVQNHITHYFNIENKKLHVLKDIYLKIYTIEGKIIIDKKVKEGEEIYLDNNYYILSIETEHISKNYKLVIK